MEPDNQQNSGATPGKNPVAPTPLVKTRPSDGADEIIGSTPANPISEPDKTSPNDGAISTSSTPDAVPEPKIAVNEPVAAAPVIPVTTTEAVPDSVPSDSTLTVSKELSIAEKLEAARVAMEGPERAAERQLREKEEKAKMATAELEAQKAIIEKDKEKLELGWISLDNTRTALKKSLEPILAEEVTVEEEEKKCELEEEGAALPEQKQVAEKKRQGLEDKRKEIEQRKWVIQDKVKRIELEIEANTKQYQPLLDEEEKIIEEIDKLKGELI